MTMTTMMTITMMMMIHDLASNCLVRNTVLHPVFASDSRDLGLLGGKPKSKHYQSVMLSEFLLTSP
jgi:hypothetical protein